jgi:hypothetical protein
MLSNGRKRIYVHFLPYFAASARAIASDNVRTSILCLYSNAKKKTIITAILSKKSNNKRNNFYPALFLSEKSNCIDRIHFKNIRSLTKIPDSCWATVGNGNCIECRRAQSWAHFCSWPLSTTFRKLSVPQFESSQTTVLYIIDRIHFKNIRSLTKIPDSCWATVGNGNCI